jgi:uncharacterized protein YbjT (DUF2867 family)
MKIIVFGASGMVGQGVLRECLLDSTVTTILVIGRSPTGTHHPKLHEIIHPDFTDYGAIESQMKGYDACFYSVGVSAVGKSEADYARVNYDFPVAAGKTLAKLNPNMTFIYVSGTGTDSTERGRIMWARVKGKTENELLKMPFKNVVMFRPGIIQPLHGIKSKTAWYRIFYTFTAPFLPLLMKFFPKYVTTTEKVGRAMLKIAKHGATQKYLENEDINQLVEA